MSMCEQTVSAGAAQILHRRARSIVTGVVVTADAMHSTT
jgi:hypothetical protein